jgi:hypothetical protein
MSESELGREGPQTKLVQPYRRWRPDVTLPA